MSHGIDPLDWFVRAMKYNFMGCGYALVVIVGWGIILGAYPLTSHQVSVPLSVGLGGYLILVCVGMRGLNSPSETPLASQGGSTYGSRNRA